VSRGTALVDTDGQIALMGDGFGDFRPQQQAPGPWLCALPNGELDRAGPTQIVHVDAIARGQHLVNIVPGKLALRWGKAAVASGIRSADLGRRFGQCSLGIVGERAPAHAGNHDRNFELQRPLGEAPAEHRPGGAFFSITLERDAGETAGQKGQVVEGRPASRT